MDLDNIARSIQTCTRCRLHATRTHTVPGAGSPDAQVMFIGEGPGRNEDAQGTPFCGRAGEFLDELLELAHLTRESVFITNVVKCRPPNNRDPQEDEIAACKPFLRSQYATVKPQVIVTLGRFSMRLFFPEAQISQIHGQFKKVRDIMVVPMYHPAAGLYRSEMKEVLRHDFIALGTMLPLILT